MNFKRQEPETRAPVFFVNSQFLKLCNTYKKIEDSLNRWQGCARMYQKYVLILKLKILAKFFQENRAEVKMLSILEYDKEWEEEKLRKAEFEAGREEGLEAGKNIGMEIGKNKGMELAELRIIQNMQNRGYSINEIAEAIGKTEDEINNILKNRD